MSKSLYIDLVLETNNTRFNEDHSAIRRLITITALMKFGYVLHVHLSLFFFSFCFCLIISHRKAMFIQRIQNQGFTRKGMFVTNKLLVSVNGSRKIMHPIRKISRSPLRTKIRN